MPPKYLLRITDLDKSRLDELLEVMEELFYQLVEKLGELGEIKYEHLFVEGTKKQDYGFRQFLLRGNKKVITEMLLMAFEFNINKLHHKIQHNRTGLQLFEKNERLNTSIIA